MNCLDIESYQLKLEKWALRHTFAAQMLFGNMTFKEKVTFAEELYGC